MTRKEMIEIAALRIYPDDQAARLVFMAGAMFAYNYPDVSSLWKEPTEYPKEGELIVCLDEENYFCSGAFYDRRVNEYNRVYKSAIWNYGKFICYWNDVKIWAYAKDLLPKGGEV